MMLSILLNIFILPVYTEKEIALVIPFIEKEIYSVKSNFKIWNSLNGCNNNIQKIFLFLYFHKNEETLKNKIKYFYK